MAAENTSMEGRSRLMTQDSGAGFAEHIKELVTQGEKRMLALQDEIAKRWEAQQKAIADRIEQHLEAQKKAIEDAQNRLGEIFRRKPE